MKDQRAIGLRYAQCLQSRRGRVWAPLLAPGSSPPCYIMPLHSLDGSGCFAGLVLDKAVHVTIVKPADVHAPLLYLCDCMDMRISGLLAADDLTSVDFGNIDKNRCAHSFALEQLLTEDQKLDLERDLEPARSLKQLDARASFGSVVRLPDEWTNEHTRCCLSVATNQQQAVLSRAVFAANSTGLVTCAKCQV